MITFLFYTIFCDGSLSEMQYQNTFVQERLKKRFDRWWPLPAFLDTVLLLMVFG